MSNNIDDKFEEIDKQLNSASTILNNLMTDPATSFLFEPPLQILTNVDTKEEENE